MCVSKLCKLLCVQIANVFADVSVHSCMRAQDTSLLQYGRWCVDAIVEACVWSIQDSGGQRFCLFMHVGTF